MDSEITSGDKKTCFVTQDKELTSLLPQDQIIIEIIEYSQSKQEALVAIGFSRRYSPMYWVENSEDYTFDASDKKSLKIHFPSEKKVIKIAKFIASYFELGSNLVQVIGSTYVFEVVPLSYTTIIRQ